MRIHRFVPAAVAAGFALITVVPADAKPTPKPKVKPATAHSIKTASHGPKTTAKAKPTTLKAHGGGAQAKAVKPTTAKGSAKAATAPGRTKSQTADVAKGSGQKVKGDKSTRTLRDDAGPGSGRPTGDDSGPGVVDIADDTRPTDTVPTTPPLSKAQQKVLSNANLRAKLASRLPAGTDVVGAAAGFRNLGQFVAAVNVSHNQGIDFVALKTLMVGPESMSLGQAIQRLKGVDLQTANTAADTAITTANRDIAVSADVSTTTKKTKRNGRG